MSTLKFCAQTHTYTLDNKQLQSVSDFIKPLSSMIEDDLFLETAIEIAADRGTTLHSVIELLLKGEDIEGEYPAQYEDYVDGIRLFLAENEVEPIYCETPFACDIYELAGTPDMIAMFNGEVAILDWKFVAQVDKVRVAAQLNSYYEICTNNGMDIEKLYVIQLLPNGKYRKYPVKIDNTDFELLRELRCRKKRKHGRGMIE